MSKNKNKIRFTDGTAFKIKEGRRESVNSLDEGLRDLAKCCGVDCCDNVIRLNDTGTGNLIEISIADGFLTVVDTVTGNTASLELTQE